jgi:hypothetical protein
MDKYQELPVLMFCAVLGDYLHLLDYFQKNLLGASVFLLLDQVVHSIALHYHQGSPGHHCCEKVVH